MDNEPFQYACMNMQFELKKRLNICLNIAFVQINSLPIVFLLFYNIYLLTFPMFSLNLCTSEANVFAIKPKQPCQKWISFFYSQL